MRSGSRSSGSEGFQQILLFPVSEAGKTEVIDQDDGDCESRFSSRS